MMAAESPGGAIAVDLCGETVLLHPERALIWPATRTLLIADPHFGKDDVFRRAGIALPPGTADADLTRLTGLIDAYACERLLVLGDFVHAATQLGDGFLAAFFDWRASHPGLVMEVIAGNHDRRERVARWHDVLRWHTSPFVDPPFVFSHAPIPDARGYVIAGHLHPVFHLSRMRRRLRVPVFWQRANSLVMPSFGSFTGGATVRPAPTDALYAVGPERVIALAYQGKAANIPR
jgi:uncharacterized protein